MSDTINRKSLKSLTEYAESRRIPIFVLENSIVDEIITRANCKALAIYDKNLAKAIQDKIGVGVNE